VLAPDHCLWGVNPGNELPLMPCCTAGVTVWLFKPGTAPGVWFVLMLPI
jgi:hypothetical protein